MTLAYYVSSHGLGHAARACEVIAALGADVPLVVRSSAAEWFFRNEITRPFELCTGDIDVSLVHRSSVTIDRQASLAAYARFASDGTRARSEAEFLRRRGVRLVVSDVPALAFSAARAAGIPSVFVGNFSWAEIYRPFLAEQPSYAESIRALEQAYGEATRSLVTELSLEMPYLRGVERVPLIARRGTRRRAELGRLLGLREEALWILYYPGVFGLEVDYRAVRELPDLELLSFAAVPGLDVKVVPGERFPHRDVVASVDAVLSKPGYMLAGECLSAGTPLILLPRPDFAEDEVLLPALRVWGGLHVLRPADFAAGRWHEALGFARAGRRPPRSDLNGAEVVAERLRELYGSTEA